MIVNSGMEYIRVVGTERDSELWWGVLVVQRCDYVIAWVIQSMDVIVWVIEYILILTGKLLESDD